MDPDGLGTTDLWAHLFQCSNELHVRLIAPPSGTTPHRWDWMGPIARPAELRLGRTAGLLSRASIIGNCPKALQVADEVYGDC